MSLTKSAADTPDCGTSNRLYASLPNAILGKSGFLAVAVLLAFGFSVLSGLIINSTDLYSVDQNYRLQTESFLSGRLSLSSDPTILLNDWAWNGQTAHQVWGLGIPLLRLPFEIVARAFGAPAFPDRIVLLLILSLGLGSAVATAIEIGRSVSTTKSGILTGLLLAIVVIFDPLLFGIAESRMLVYEEAALGMSCFGLLLWRLVVLTAGQACKRNFWLLAIVAGFSFWIRPTSIFYSIPALLIVSTIEAKNAKLRRCLFDCWAVFFLLTGAYLVLNWIRFGLPWEFGHSINYTFPRNAFGLRFGTKLALSPLGSLIGELNQALFACLPSKSNVFYEKDPCGTVLTPFRFREYYISSYSIVEGLFFAAGMSWCFCMLAFGKLRQWIRTPAGISILWGACSTALVYAFYIRSPSLSSRYLLDFMPGLAAMIAGLLGSCFSQIKGASGRTALFGIYICIAGWRIHEVADLKIVPEMKGPNLLNMESALALYPEIRHPASGAKELPVKMSCPDDLLRFGSAAPRGWKFADSCNVDQITTMILRSDTCIEIDLEFTRSERQRMAATGNFASTQIRIIRGLVTLEKTRVQIDGTILRLDYCSTTPPDENSSLISIRWKAPQIANIESPSYRLRSVSTVPLSQLN
jgi:hypothetical protein